MSPLLSFITAAPGAGAPWGVALTQAAGVLLLPLVWLGVAALQHPLAFIHALLGIA